jgi:hypothetical protein
MTILIEMLQGNDEAWKEHEEYYKMDVVVTEEIYERMKPYVKPHLSLIVGSNLHVEACATCGSDDLTKDGYHFTSVSKFQQYKCNSCKSFSRGRHNLIPKEVRSHLLAPVTGV